MRTRSRIGRVLIGVMLAAAFVLMALPRVAAYDYPMYYVRVTATGPNRACTVSYTGTDPIYPGRGVHFNFGYSYWLYAPGWWDNAVAKGYIQDDQLGQRNVGTGQGPIYGTVYWDMVYPNPGTYKLKLTVDGVGTDGPISTCDTNWVSHTFTVIVY